MYICTKKNGFKLFVKWNKIIIIKKIQNKYTFMKKRYACKWVSDWVIVV